MTKSPIKLCDLYDEINALGGVATSERDKGYCEAVNDALDIVVRLGTQPPAHGTWEWAYNKAKTDGEKICYPGLHVKFIEFKGGRFVFSNGETCSMHGGPKISEWSIWVEPAICMICGNEIQNKEDGPPTANGISLAHYECHGKYESYHALVSLREGVKS